MRVQVLIKKNPLKRIFFLIFFIILVWQLSGLIPIGITQRYPTSDFQEITTNQIFIYEMKWSFFPGSMSGCLYFPNLFDSHGERIQTAGGAGFIEPDSFNDVVLQPGEQITVQVKAACGIWLVEDILTVYEPVVLEQRYKVGEKTLSKEEKMSALVNFGGADPKVLRMFNEVEDILKSNDKF